MRILNILLKCFPILSKIRLFIEKTVFAVDHLSTWRTNELLFRRFRSMFWLDWTHNDDDDDDKGEVTKGQFHQHFTSSFYTCRSEKRQKDSQLKQLFLLSGSAGVKAARKRVDEIDLKEWRKDQFHQHVGAKLKCVGAQCVWSKRCHSVSPTKLYPILLVHII